MHIRAKTQKVRYVFKITKFVYIFEYRTVIFYVCFAYINNNRLVF